MAPTAVPKDLVAVLTSPQTSLDYATDAVEEYIAYRRVKGDTLFDVSVGLVELEDRAPRQMAAVAQARYKANVPPPSDLTPPMGPFPLARSATPLTVLAHLLSTPTPTIQHSREVILEYVLAREAKLREKKAGRGGKGTLARDGFEEIAHRLSEIEDGLRGSGPLANAKGLPPPPPPSQSGELDEARQIALTLILSLRMLLSYFTIPDLIRQLLCQSPPDAERTLVQHIRRRVPSEGRFGIGKELEYIESMTLYRRPALRPAFRSARARTHLPVRATYPIALAAPSKSVCTKLLSSFVRDIEQAGPSAAASFMQGGPLSPNSPLAERTGFLKRAAGSPITATAGGSPSSQLALLPPAPTSPSNSFGISLGGDGQNQPIPLDPNPISSYALELISEFITREKREYMLKNKWAKSGRDQLSKDLGEIEASLCVTGKNTPSPHASSLLPTFLLLRRTFALPSSPLPVGITETYLDILPVPPDADFIPLREPTVSSTTAALYVNPRLDDAAALEVLQELVESEREKAEADEVSMDETEEWLVGLVDQVQKRFPDGSYEHVFDLAKDVLVTNRPSCDTFSSAQLTKPTLTQGGHRRAVSSSFETASASFNHQSQARSPSRSHLAKESSLGYLNHVRSSSMPMRSDPLEISPERSDESSSPEASLAYRRKSIDSSESADSEFARKVIPLSLSMPSQHIRDKQPPPILNLVLPKSDLNIFSSSSPEPQKGDRPTSGNGPEISPVDSTSGGWWDIVSAIDHDMPAPWQRRRSSNIPISNSTHAPLPPGAEAAAVSPISTSPSIALIPPEVSPSRAPVPQSTSASSIHIHRPQPLQQSPPRVTRKSFTIESPPQLYERSIAFERSPAFDRVAPYNRTAAFESPVAPSAPSILSAQPVPSASASASNSASGSPATSLWKAEIPQESPMSGTLPPARSSPFESQSGSRPSSGATRPPPVPLRFDRPGFPTPGGSPLPTPPPSARESFAHEPGHVLLPGMSPTPAQVQVSMPSPLAPTASASKSKFGFSRSVSLAGRNVMTRGKDKDKYKEKEKVDKENNERHERNAATGRKDRVTNNPGKWNRDMVAGIMGPPAERR